MTTETNGDGVLRADWWGQTIGLVGLWGWVFWWQFYDMGMVSAEPPPVEIAVLLVAWVVTLNATAMWFR